MQEFPRARAAIKYLVADGRYHYLETGSLVSIQENVSDIVIPSEEDNVKMYPFDFEEFLWATGREGLVDVISSHLLDKESMGAAHRKAKDAFREYLVVGGMPQAVIKWVETFDLKKVDAAKRRIIALYRADIRKHAGKYAMKAEAIFDEIPGQLQKHDKKFRLSALGEEARAREYGDAFLWLKVFVTKMLRDYDGDPMDKALYSLHTLASEHGWTRICHYGSDSWTPGVSLYKIYIKCALWLNIYEVHLKTGKPMEYYLKRQA